MGGVGGKLHRVAAVSSSSGVPSRQHTLHSSNGRLASVLCATGREVSAAQLCLLCLSVQNKVRVENSGQSSSCRTQQAGRHSTGAPALRITWMSPIDTPSAFSGWMRAAECTHAKRGEDG